MNIIKTIHLPQNHYAIIDNKRTRSFSSERFLVKYLLRRNIYLSEYRAIESKAITGVDGISSTTKIVWGKI